MDDSQTLRREHPEFIGRLPAAIIYEGSSSGGRSDGKSKEGLIVGRGGRECWCWSEGGRSMESDLSRVDDCLGILFDDCLIFGEFFDDVSFLLVEFRRMILGSPMDAFRIQERNS